MASSIEHADVLPFSWDTVAAAVLDRDGTVLHWSGAAAELLDRSAAEVCGKPVGHLLADTSHGRCRGVADRAHAPKAGRARLRHRSGDDVEVAFQILPLETGSGFVVLAASARWVGDAAQGAALLRALLAQDRIGISIHDADLRLVRTNLTPERFGGPGTPLDLPHGAGLSAADAGAVDSALHRVLTTGVPLIGHEPRPRPSQRAPGRQSPSSLSAVRLEDARGRPAGVAALITDTGGQRRSQQHVELLHRASARIGRSLDVRRTAQDLVDVLVPALGDVAWVNLAEAVFYGDEPPKLVGAGDPHLRRAALASAVEPWPDALLQPGAPIPPYRDTPGLRSLQHGGAVILDPKRAIDLVDSREPDERYLPEHGHSALWAPLFARGLVLGTVTVWRTEEPAPFDQGDADLLTEITSRAALSVDNARRYTREHRASLALQQHLLPRRATDTAAAETTGIYLPAADGAEVSGDWFDAIPLPSLRTALVVGDVVGHGLRASATMGRLRTAIHTLSDLEMDPDELLTHLDDLVTHFTAETDPARKDPIAATCLYALYDPVSRRCTLAAAGHPPPVLILPDGTARLIELTPGPPLGVGGMPFETTTLELPPGSVLALYTDGLIEGADHDPEAGLRHLIDRLATHCRGDRPLDALGRVVLAETADPSPRDDIALLLARTRALAPDATATWEFAADPAVVAQARAAAAYQLGAWGLDEASFVTELIVSELVTNAIRYAGGPVGLRLIRDETLICEVTDSSNTQPRLRRARTSDEGGRGLFLVAQLARRWGCRYGQSGKTIWAEEQLAAEPMTV
ncbi:SpoIIE family protein phosphatase [Streptomyces rhizosphaericus]|uniref:protein-serine/threonine phosphatase n=1 Tax=Streptomyces rhizosphaericus TaxID=114699 RepID=A0A6G4AJH8_9ACTN|nr:SpoIIE family protein phosphatase [Streptomyces rhizosphaericus]NEW72954.1 SpoIIE family protein phosphatase [Streptomyces rhizosphaericus]